ncbi:phosphopeptide-binding protein [Moorena producens 3L]|nr:phosphopeptide-binding protein [Moorena producens 3L]
MRALFSTNYPFDHERFMATQSDHNHLLIIEDDKGSKQIPLEEEVYSIGRDPESDIRLFSKFVSRRHATLVRRRRSDGSPYYRIFDGNLKGKASSNGILINGRKLQAHDLEDEDEVIFAPKVSAKYYLLKRENTPTDPVDQMDEYDITLINPGMIDDSEEWDN